MDAKLDSFNNKTEDALHLRTGLRVIVNLVTHVLELSSFIRHGPAVDVGRVGDAEGVCVGGRCPAAGENPPPTHTHTPPGRAECLSLPLSPARSFIYRRDKIKQT